MVVDVHEIHPVLQEVQVPPLRKVPEGQTQLPDEIMKGEVQVKQAEDEQVAQ